MSISIEADCNECGHGINPLNEYIYCLDCFTKQDARILDLENKIEELENEISVLEGEVESLETRIEDLEYDGE